LAAAVRPIRQDLDIRYGESIAAIRAAAVELHRRIGADRRWDGRFGRAILVRQTLEAAPEAVAGSLFSLVADVIADLDAVPRPLPAPTRAAVDRLRAALAAATPQP
jgi:hypothetical protein